MSFSWSCSVEAEVVSDSVLKAYYVSFFSVYSSAALHIKVIFQYTTSALYTRCKITCTLRSN